MSGTAGDLRRLATLVPFVREHLSTAPSRVLEIGCGPLGGFVPALTAAGHEVVGVDPEAPEGKGYVPVGFEDYEVPEQVDAVVASTSLHHVADLADVLDKVADSLVPGGVVIVLEWAHEWFDEATARWCFDHLTPPTREESWLHHHRDQWQTQGGSWDSYFSGWVAQAGLHRGADVLRALDERFESQTLLRTPYAFADLDDTTEADEQAAIDSALIRPTGIRYAGRRPTYSHR